MNNHTTGEWRKVLAPTQIVTDSKVIATLNDHRLDGGHAEMQANADLLAAAPRLKAVVERLVSWGANCPQSRQLTVADLQGIITDAHQALEVVRGAR